MTEALNFAGMRKKVAPPQPPTASQPRQPRVMSEPVAPTAPVLKRPVRIESPEEVLDEVTHPVEKPSTQEQDIANPLLDDDDEALEVHRDVSNPLLDDEEEDESTSPAVTPTGKETASAARSRQSTRKVNVPVNAKQAAPTADAAARKARRAARREQNHIEHPVWYRRALTEEDRIFLRFLVRFKYAKASHLAQLLGVSEHSAYKRLKALDEYGYVAEWKLHDSKSVWFPTSEGRNKAVRSLKLASSKITWQDLPHQFVVNYLSASIEGGTVNVLNSPGWQPLQIEADERETALRNGQAFGGKERRAIRDSNRAIREARQGQIVSEHEIEESLRTKRRELRAGHGADADINGLIRHEAHQLVRSTTSPELQEGFQWLWLLLPERRRCAVDPDSGQVLYKQSHQPDFVLKRDPASDGSPRSVAFEVELKHKAHRRIMETLAAYKAVPHLYSKVVWVVPDSTLRAVILSCADKLSMLDQVEVMPLYVQKFEDKPRESTAGKRFNEKRPTNELIEFDSDEFHRL